jgi:hypothetical protein
MSRKGSYKNQRVGSTTVVLEEPTEAQRAWTARLETLLGQLEELEREGRRLRGARLDAPEAVLLRWLVPLCRDGLSALRAARSAGCELAIVRREDGCKALRVAPPTGRVIPFRSQGSEQNPHENT